MQPGSLKTSANVIGLRLGERHRFSAPLVGYPRLACSILAGLLCLSGCRFFSQSPSGPPRVEVAISNPFQVGPADPTLVWEQVADAVDDYFRIKSETPVRRDSAAWLEGRLETFPEIASTLLEPWRRDSTPGFERMQATIQTIRRTAYVKVIPGPDGYLIDVKVIKEQEDVDDAQGLSATTGESTAATTGVSTSVRSEGTGSGSLIRSTSDIRDMPSTVGWYPAGIGRDLELERRLAEQIAGRLTNIEPPRKGGLHMP